MKSLFVECPTGLAGDMLLAAFLDLGVPKEEIESPLASLGLTNSYVLRNEENYSFGLRGIKVSVENIETVKKKRSWLDIKKMINKATWQENFKEKVFLVFKCLAEAEAAVHGCAIDEVHFHEIGAIDSLVDVVGVCAAVEYLNPSKLLCSVPPVGSGSIETSHGLLPVPAPAVLELAKRHHIKLLGGASYPQVELTTPTGLALMAVLSDGFEQPISYEINSIGVGLGHKVLDRPNFVRVMQLEDSPSENKFFSEGTISWQPIVSQEAWIDDSTPEDLSTLVEELRSSGAIDVICQSVQMKKGRQGVCIKAIVAPEKASSLRWVWLMRGTTLGLRERTEGRWVLPRRRGFCMTKAGKIPAKQIRRPDGCLTIKFEHDGLVRLSEESSKPLSLIKQDLFTTQEEFFPEEDWQC